MQGVPSVERNGLGSGMERPKRATIAIEAPNRLWKAETIDGEIEVRRISRQCTFRRDELCAKF
jgi:hypothetical protein